MLTDWNVQSYSETLLDRNIKMLGKKPFTFGITWLAPLYRSRLVLRPPSDLILRHKELISVTSEALAALGILAAGATFTYDSYQARQSSLTGAIIYSTPSHISLLVSNDGGKDLVIQRVTLRSGLDIKSTVVIDPKGLLVEKGKSKILSSNRSKLNSTVQFQAPQEGEEPIARQPTTPCQALIDYVVAGSQSRTASIDFICHAATLWDSDNLERIEQLLYPQN